jgi:hypothetical protein
MAALWPLAAGHLLGMLVVMLPFAFLDALVEWQRFDPEWRQPRSVGREPSDASDIHPSFPVPSSRCPQ